jgi:hypothetical protein
VVPAEFAAGHAAAVVEGDERALATLRPQFEAARARVERVGHDLREDRLLEAARIRVPEVLEQVHQVYARFAQSAKPR